MFPIDWYFSRDSLMALNVLESIATGSLFANTLSAEGGVPAPTMAETPAIARPTLADTLPLQDVIRPTSEHNLIPSPIALFRRGKKWMVFTVDNGKAESREVEIG